MHLISSSDNSLKQGDTSSKEWDTSLKKGDNSAPKYLGGQLILSFLSNNCLSLL